MTNDVKPIWWTTISVFPFFLCLLLWSIVWKFQQWLDRIQIPSCLFILTVNCCFCCCWSPHKHKRMLTTRDRDENPDRTRRKHFCVAPIERRNHNPKSWMERETTHRWEEKSKRIKVHQLVVEKSEGKKNKSERLARTRVASRTRSSWTD